MSLDKEANESGHRKKQMELVGAQRDVAFVMEKFEVSECRACELNHIDRSTYRCQPSPTATDLRKRLIALAHERPRWGYRRLGVLLEEEGRNGKPEGPFRVYQQVGLCVRRRERERLARNAATMPLFMRPNQ